MIAVIDYGMGNLRSAKKGLQQSGADAFVTSDPERIRRADGVVLPGVGAFGACMENLRSRGLERPVRDFVDSGKPFLGICVGMQILFDESEEFGRVPGLGILPGKVRRFAGSEMAGLKIPQMGWNRLSVRRAVPEFDGIEDGAFVYFVHSFYVEPASDGLVAATTDYGLPFASAVSRGNVFGTQFHPEKSQAVGLRMLANFAARVAARAATPGVA